MYFSASLIWLLLFNPSTLLFASQFAQEPQTFTVRGTVVNSATNEPIRGALVQLFAGRQLSRLTGADGQFAFESVPAGTFAVQARKPGFFFASEIPMSGASPIMVTAGPDHPSPAVLKLIPEGIIHGHILGDDGEPIESLPVQVFCELVENGKRVRTGFRSANTDEQGEFRMAELPPNKYFVLVGPSRTPSSFSPKPLEGGARGYAATFYPGVPDLAGAIPLEITPGKQVETDLTLSSQPFYRILGSVSGDLQHQNVAFQLTAVGGQPDASSFQIDPAKGTFHSQWLPVGLYTLSAEAREPSTGQEFFAVQNLNLTSNLTVSLVLLPSLNIPVAFQVETTRSDSQPAPGPTVSFGPHGTRHIQGYIPARVALTLQQQSLPPRQFYAEAVNGNEAAGVIHNVLPGTYSVEVSPNGPYYVQSLRSGSLNLLDQNLTIATGAPSQPIEVVLRDDCATLEGNISSEEGGQFGMVVVIPEGSPQRARNSNLYWQTDRTLSHRSSASFEMPQLAPGSYRVLAVDDPSFEYANPDVLQKYLPQAQQVLLAPNQRSNVRLAMIHIGVGQ